MKRRANRHCTGALARLSAVTAAVAFAGLALGSGLDRAASASGGLAKRLPAFFAGQSAQLAAGDAITSGDPDAIETVAKLIIDRQPLNPAGPALLGYAHAQVGDAAGADLAYGESAKLGWRSPLTQEYWMRRAFNGGDYRVAALQLDALLRQTPKFARNEALLSAFETTAPARDALLNRMVQQPNWMSRYFSEVTDLSPAATLNRAVMANALRLRGLKLGCKDVRPLAEAMVSQKAVAQASALWRSQCSNPGGANALLWDGNFAAIDLNASPNALTWQVIGSGDVSLMPGREGLQVSSSGAFELMFLQQMLVVPAGAYRLSWRAADSSGGKAMRLVPKLLCGSSETTPTAALVAADSWQAELRIDGSCPVNWLRFGITAGEGTVTLGQIALTPLAKN
jgi:hypothetical protein